MSSVAEKSVRSVDSPTGASSHPESASLEDAKDRRSSEEELHPARKSISRKYKYCLPSWLNQSATDPSKVIGVRHVVHPNLHYDLLPPRLKHCSYMLLADLNVPRTRLILQHRVVYRDYSELDVNDRFELVHLAMTIAKDFDFLNSSLTIPLGAAKVFDNGKGTFYSYIIVPSVINFIRVFNVLKSELPKWPDLRWRTKLWPSCDEEPTFDRVYERSLHKYREMFHDPEVILAPRSTKVPVILAKHRIQKTAGTKGPSFGLFQHSYLSNILAVATSRNVITQSCESRWMLLDSVFQSLSKWCDLNKVKCHLSLSLSEPYQFCTIAGCDTFVLLQFPEGIPDSLKSKIRFTGSQKRREIRKEKEKRASVETQMSIESVDGDFSRSHSSVSRWDFLISKLHELKSKERGVGIADAPENFESSVKNWQNLVSKVKSLNVTKQVPPTASRS